MGNLMLLLLALAFSNAEAVEVYSCLSRSGENAILRMEEPFIDWNEPGRAVISDGIAIGIETATVDWLGYQRYRLTDFYSTPNSHYVLAIPPSHFGNFTVYLYFDNNTRAQDITRYLCGPSRL